MDPVNSTLPLTKLAEEALFLRLHPAEALVAGTVTYGLGVGEGMVCIYAEGFTTARRKVTTVAGYSPERFAEEVATRALVAQGKHALS